MEEQAKHKLPNKTSFKPGQSGNPAGRPKVYKSIEELKEVLRKEHSKYIVSGKMFRDLDSMTELKRVTSWMEIIKAFELYGPTGEENKQLPPSDMKILVQLGGPVKSETIELKQKEEGKYE